MSKSKRSLYVVTGVGIELSQTLSGQLKTARFFGVVFSDAQDLIDDKSLRHCSFLTDQDAPSPLNFELGQK